MEVVAGFWFSNMGFCNWVWILEIKNKRIGEYENRRIRK